MDTLFALDAVFTTEHLELSFPRAMARLVKEPSVETMFKLSSEPSRTSEIVSAPGLMICSESFLKRIKPGCVRLKLV